MPISHFPLDRRTLRRLLTLSALVFALSACSRTTQSPLIGASCEMTPTKESLETAADTGVTAAAFEAVPVARAGSMVASAPFVSGDVIVKFASATRASPPQHVQAAGRALERTRPLGLPGVGLYRAPGLDRAGTLDVVTALQARPDVLYAHPNYLVSRAATPTDEHYDLQWSYRDIDLPSAWDLTVSCDEVAVAVLDTGMLMEHPDRPTHLVSGYDFVSDENNPDGDGRDGDPQDPGPRSETDYHGSHVTGTIGAATNNDLDADGKGEGVAGASWYSKVVPIRVLGPTGTAADLVDAIRWAAGEPVDSVPPNPNPARVLNLSLGSKASCSGALQEAIDIVRGKGAVVIAAAGNSNDDASTSLPANCSGVLTVGATDARGDRAPYSNWGSVVDLMAPGGQAGTDENLDLMSDEIYSLSRTDGGAYGYQYLRGTSMATAHVSGVVALMVSVQPRLTPDEIESILAATARPLTDQECDSDGASRVLTSADCGAGKIDALAAVSAAQSW